MKYKAIISDVDGTLVRHGSAQNLHSLPSFSVTSAIARVKNTVHVGVATSRPLAGVTYLFDHLSLSGPSILFGGSLILDSKSREILWEKTVPHEAALEVARIAEKHHIDITINETSEKPIRNKKGYVPNSPLNMFLAELSKEQLEAIHNELRKIPDIAIHKTPSWNNQLWAFDITHIEATKQHGVLQVAQMLGISTEEIIGIGDGYNDFPLLMACGLKVAIGNAVEELKAIADYVAPSVEENGVADVIEKFILND